MEGQNRSTGLSIKNQGGFIVIIGLGLFAIMAIFIILIQKQNMRMVDNIEMWNNQASAEFLGTSALEWLQYKVNKDEGGEPFNYASGKCKFTRGTSAGGGTRGGSGSVSALIGDSSNPSFCSEIYDELLVNDTKSQTVEIELAVKGNMESRDVLTGTNGCYVNIGGTIATNCYINPLPKTGSAGTNCKAYNPSTNQNVDPIDHPCNWNKLEFGSNMIDRVVVPLYYKNSGGTDFIEPFLGQQRAQFAIKIRTPCKINADSFGYCADSDRYVLDETEDDVVAQWQLSGKCEDDECTFLPKLDTSPLSTIKESLVNDRQTNATKYIVIDSLNNEILSTSKINSSDDFVYQILTQQLQKPILTLFLMDKLQSLTGSSRSSTENVPYLEYQIVTGVPVGNSKMEITATVSVNGNVFKRTLSKNYRKGIIDFAVQN